MLSAIRCWNFGHSDTSIGSEWLCRAEMILESYAKVDSNQFKTGKTPLTASAVQHSAQQ